MPYAVRNKGGEITGLCAGPQGDATEFLPDDHPDVAAFYVPKPPPVDEIAALKARVAILESAKR